jgi:hypothetical protein
METIEAEPAELADKTMLCAFRELRVGRRDGGSYFRAIRARAIMRP